MVHGKLRSGVLSEEWLDFLPSKVLLRYVSLSLPLGCLRVGDRSEMKLLAMHPHSLRKSPIFFDSTCTKFLRRGPFPIHTSRKERFAWGICVRALHRWSNQVFRVRAELYKLLPHFLNGV